MNAVAPATIDANELVTFIQHLLPGFRDGEYQLSMRQHVEQKDGTPIAEDSLEQAYTFAVLGDRFSLADPAGTIYATFPDNAASGEYQTVLPHIVFNAPTLPWARSPDATEQPAPAGDSPDVPTWLAILLLDADDVAASPGFGIEAADATIGDLLPVALSPNSTLGDKLSYFAGATDLSDLEPGQTLTTPIRILDLPLPLFKAIAPTRDDLALLAHVRSVSLVNKPTLPGISDIGEPVGRFSIVIGNRLPADGETSVAHLVSLEGLAGLLPTDPPTPPSDGDAAKAVRLAVLKSWSFTSTGSTATFTNALLSLNGRDPKGTADAPVTALRLAQATVDPATSAALAAGYVPLDHDLRDGGGTVSWYRGPLAPVTVPAGRITVPVASADQALIFDPASGLLDASYAAAWTLGRLMSLQDKAFSVALYNWKRGLSRQVVDSAEEEVLALGTPAATLDRATPAAAARAAPLAALTHAESAPLADALHRSLLLSLAPEGLKR